VLLPFHGESVHETDSSPLRCRKSRSCSGPVDPVSRQRALVCGGAAFVRAFPPQSAAPGSPE
jgi:hypothetical protein